jgi:hypothetical protein
MWCCQIAATVGPGLAYVDVIRTDNVTPPSETEEDIERIESTCEQDELLIADLELERLLGPLPYHGWFGNCHQYVNRRKNRYLDKVPPLEKNERIKKKSRSRR